MDSLEAGGADEGGGELGNMLVGKRAALKEACPDGALGAGTGATFRGGNWTGRASATGAGRGVIRLVCSCRVPTGLLDVRGLGDVRRAGKSRKNPMIETR